MSFQRRFAFLSPGLADHSCLNAELELVMIRPRRWNVFQIGKKRKMFHVGRLKRALGGCLLSPMVSLHKGGHGHQTAKA